MVPVTPKPTVNTATCALLQNFNDAATNTTYLKTACLLNSSLTFSQATAACSNIGMAVYDIGNSSDSRTDLIAVARNQSTSIKFWVQDSTITSTCPRIEFISSLWKENTNANCSEQSAVFCEFNNSTGKMVFNFQVCKISNLNINQ